MFEPVMRLVKPHKCWNAHRDEEELESINFRDQWIEMDFLQRRLITGEKLLYSGNEQEDASHTQGVALSPTQACLENQVWPKNACLEARSCPDVVQNSPESIHWMGGTRSTEHPFAEARLNSDEQEKGVLQQIADYSGSHKMKHHHCCGCL